MSLPIGKGQLSIDSSQESRKFPLVWRNSYVSVPCRKVCRWCDAPFEMVLREHLVGIVCFPLFCEVIGIVEVRNLSVGDRWWSAWWRS